MILARHHHSGRCTFITVEMNINGSGELQTNESIRRRLMKRNLTLGLVLAFLLAALAFFSVKANLEFDCANVTEIPQIECEALVVLYNSTNGPVWKDSTNWLVTNTPSNWHGVTVASGRVT
jgi:hypothetical protein